MGVFRPANMILIFLNVLFFMTVQTLFFQFIASKQFNVVLRDKADIVSQYLKYNETAKQEYAKFKGTKYVKTIMNDAELQEKKRNDANLETMMYWIGIPFLISVFLLITFIVLHLYQDDNKWSAIDWSLMTLILGAYITEILFYLGIVSQYQFYGDHSIFANIYQTMNKTVNKDPITRNGKKVMFYIDRILESASDVDEAKQMFLDISKEIPAISLGEFEQYAKTYFNAVSVFAVEQFEKQKKKYNKKKRN